MVIVEKAALYGRHIMKGDYSMELYMIRYVKYQSDGGEYHSQERYFFGKYAATEHFEKVFNWLHNLSCDKVIADYNIGMQLIH